MTRALRAAVLQGVLISGSLGGTVQNVALGPEPGWRVRDISRYCAIFTIFRTEGYGQGGTSVAQLASGCAGHSSTPPVTEEKLAVTVYGLLAELGVWCIYIPLNRPTRVTEKNLHF